MKVGNLPELSGLEEEELVCWGQKKKRRQIKNKESEREEKKAFHGESFQTELPQLQCPPPTTITR